MNRAFATAEWVNSYPHYSLHNLPIVDTDHGPILLNFEQLLPFRYRPFRFELMWTSHPNYKDIIRQAWEIQTKGSRAAQLFTKLSNVRKEAVKWNKLVFGRLDNDIKHKLAELQEIQDSIDSLKVVRKEKSVREELEVLLNREETMRAQKARSNWILNGDGNTRYFQTVVKQRRARSKILHIKDEEGLLIEDLLEIENRLVNHFKSSYEDLALLSVDSILSELQSLNIPKLSHQQCLDMSRLVNSWEIEDTIFQLGPHKALGPDGIPAFFYQ